MLLDRLVRFLLPRQDHFFTLLEEVGTKMTAAAAVFGELAGASGHAQFAAIAARLKPIETEADKVCHKVYAELDRTFVTPIDREDLAHLTSALDDVVDDMEHSAAFAALYRFETLTDPMRQLIRITTQAVTELARAVGNLRKFGDPESIREVTVAVHTLENEADAVYRTAIGALFATDLDARELVRQKDMLFSLENGVDQCEDAMDVIRSVVVKNG
jgi:predicted phosphate transport protein (TIGR00153 family)